MGAFLIEAYDVNHKKVTVDEVERGKACNCTCIFCGKKLLARQGPKREHCFAHIDNIECKGNLETELHKMAKDILMEEKCIRLPESEEAFFPSGLVSLTDIHSEKWDEALQIRPDAEGILPDGRRLLIEFHVSHKVPTEKKRVIIDNNILCVEINLNWQIFSRKHIRSFLIEEDYNRKWITEPKLYIARSDSSSFSMRHPILDKVKMALLNRFYESSILIFPWKDCPQPFDLKFYRYDICEPNRAAMGVKADLLLYRSKMDDKGYIAISIRSRRRNKNQRIPSKLRLIDIIIPTGSDEASAERFFSNGILRDNSNHPLYKMEFRGFKPQ